MNTTDHKFTAYQIHTAYDMPITTGPIDREWMDKSDQRAAYRCLPLTMANQAGWFIHNPVGFTAIWDGGLSKESVSIAFDQPGGRAGSGMTFGINVVSFMAPIVHRESRITSHFGSGIVTFSLPYLFRTPAGVNLWVKGPTNWIKDGAQPLEGFVETDWLPFTFTMNWKLTRPNWPVRFERGDPICMVVPVPRGLAETLEPAIVPLEANPELEREYRQWEVSRAEFNADLAAKRRDAVERGWQRDYMKGFSVTGKRAEIHQTRLQLREFQPGEPAKDEGHAAPGS